MEEAVRSLESLSVCELASLNSLIPTGDRVCGVSLDSSATVQLIDAALRLSPPHSDDQQWAAHVRKVIDDGAALEEALAAAVADTQAGKRAWQNATAMREIYACAHERLHAIERASDALLASLAKGAARFEGAASLSLLGAAIHLRRQVVPTRAHQKALGEQFAKLSAITLSSLAAALHRLSSALVAPADLFGELDEAWRLGTARPQAVGQLEEQVQLAQHALALVDPTADEVSKRSVEERLATARRLLADVARAREYVAELRERCKRLPFAQGFPASWLTSIETRWPPHRSQQVLLSTIVGTMERQAMQHNAMLRQTESNAASNRDRQAADYRHMEQSVQQEHHARGEAEREVQLLRQENARQTTEIARLKAEVKRLHEANANIGRAAAAAAAAAAGAYFPSSSEF
ncbi:hypothetical protein AB1Y20_008837 [Prymnesium parvum]|uniref:Uncharacterized protein n=1 Tax=Prymnesium parvum TaxID=97485 RepID=A0AB34ISC8_PRYPA